MQRMTSGRCPGGRLSRTASCGWSRRAPHRVKGAVEVARRRRQPRLQPLETSGDALVRHALTPAAALMSSLSRMRFGAPWRALVQHGDHQQSKLHVLELVLAFTQAETA